MFTLNDLRAELAGLQADAKALLAGVEADGRDDLTDAEIESANKIEAEVARVSAEIEKAQKSTQADVSQDVQARLRRVLGADEPGAIIRPSVPSQTFDINDPIGAAAAMAEQMGVPLSRVLMQDPAMRGGFERLADFAYAVKQGSKRQNAVLDPRLVEQQAAPTNFHRETSSEEGFLVPPAYRAQVWELVYSGRDLLGLVDPEPTEGNIVTIPVDESTPWSGGVTVYDVAEGAQITPSRLDTEGRQVRLHKKAVLVLASDELLADAPRLESRLTRKSAEALRFSISENIADGNGNGRARGWMQSPALVVVAKESGQAGNTVVADNVLKMFSRLWTSDQSSPTGGGPFWHIHRSVLTQLPKMTLGDQPIWLPPSGFAAPPGGTLFGLPVYITQHAKALGAEGDIQLVDPTGYYATNKTNGIVAAQSMHLYFDYDLMAFRWTIRFGGLPFLEAAITPQNGSDTQSHFVTLAVRA